MTNVAIPPIINSDPLLNTK